MSKPTTSMGKDGVTGEVTQDNIGDIIPIEKITNLNARNFLEES